MFEPTAGRLQLDINSPLINIYIYIQTAMLGTREYTLCSPFRANAHNSSFCMFSKFVNFVPIDLKIGTHIDCRYTMYLAHTQCIDQNNVRYVFMATKYSIIKHGAFFKTLTFFISANNEDIG